MLHKLHGQGIVQVMPASGYVHDVDLPSTPARFAPVAVNYMECELQYKQY